MSWLRQTFGWMFAMLAVLGCGSDFRHQTRPAFLEPRTPTAAQSFDGSYRGPWGAASIKGDSVWLRANELALYRAGDSHGYGFGIYRVHAWYAGSLLDTGLVMTVCGSYPDSTTFYPIPDSVSHVTAGWAHVQLNADSTIGFDAWVTTASGTLWPAQTAASIATLWRIP